MTKGPVAAQSHRTRDRQPVSNESMSGQLLIFGYHLKAVMSTVICLPVYVESDRRACGRSSLPSIPSHPVSVDVSDVLLSFDGREQKKYYCVPGTSIAELQLVVAFEPRRYVCATVSTTSTTPNIVGLT